MTDYPAEIHSAIVARLSPLLSEGVDVLGVGDRDSDAMARRTKRVLVAYVASSFTAPSEGFLAPLVQTRTLDFDVAVQLSNLKTYAEGYPILLRVLELLAGFVPLADIPRRLYPTRDAIEDVADGVYTWVMSFSINLPVRFN